MFDNIPDPYDRITALENEVMQLWFISNQLSEQFKQTSELNVRLSEHIRLVGQALTQLEKMIRNVEFRTTVLEARQNEKAISRPIR